MKEVITDIERGTYKFVEDLALRHGSVEREGRGYFAPRKEDWKEVLIFPDFDKWRSFEDLEIKTKAQELYRSLEKAWISYQKKNLKEFEEVLKVLSAYVKEGLAGIRVFLDFVEKKPVLALYNLSILRALYLVLRKENVEEVYREVSVSGLDRIKLEDILNVWFIEWTRFIK